MAFKSGLVLLVLLALIVEKTLASAQVNVTDIVNSNGLLFNGTCPDLKKIPKLNASITAGTWYLQYLNPGILYRGKKCAWGNLTLENGTLYFKQYQTDIR
jgi:hypothetical protein